jgi:hypothetical protein
VAIVVVNEIEGGSQELYDEINPRVMPDGLPEGCQAHIAGPVDTGWRVITVWESDEAFQQFRDGTLLPVMREVAEDRIAPSISTNPVYRLITS